MNVPGQINFVTENIGSKNFLQMFLLFVSNIKTSLQNDVPDKKNSILHAALKNQTHIPFCYKIINKKEVKKTGIVTKLKENMGLIDCPTFVPFCGWICSIVQDDWF